MVKMWREETGWREEGRGRRIQMFAGFTITIHSMQNEGPPMNTIFKMCGELIKKEISEFECWSYLTCPIFGIQEAA